MAVIVSAAHPVGAEAFAATFGGRGGLRGAVGGDLSVATGQELVAVAGAPQGQAPVPAQRRGD